MGNQGDLLLCREEVMLMNDNMKFLPSYAKVSKNDFVISLGEVKKATNFDFGYEDYSKVITNTGFSGWINTFCLSKVNDE